MKEPVRWVGSEPDKCDMCGANLVGVFYDAKIPRAGSWGMVCATCFNIEECELGMGHGQEYRKMEGDWLKVAG